jgi:hypothetical protein
LSLTIDGTTSEVFYLEVASPVYDVTLDQYSVLVFPSKDAGYAPLPNETITITNTGNMPSGPIEISVSGDDFIISGKDISDIPLGGEVTFGLRPKDGLLPGLYQAVVTVGTSNISTESFDVSFTVTSRTGNLVTGTDMPVTVSISGTNIFVMVENDVSFLPVDLTISDGAQWKLFSDMTFTDEIEDKNMILAEGANIAFIVVTAEDGSTRNYSISVLRMQGEPLLGYPQTGDGDLNYYLLLLLLTGALLPLMKKRVANN